jgi:hypothetical protein
MLRESFPSHPPRGTETMRHPACSVVSGTTVSREWKVLFEEEVILPEQLVPDPLSRHGAELSLLWAVFVDGIQTYRRTVQHGLTAGIEFLEAERWIFGPETASVTSFGNLCAIFDVDPARVRGALRRFRSEVSAGDDLRIVDRGVADEIDDLLAGGVRK